MFGRKKEQPAPQPEPEPLPTLAPAEEIKEVRADVSRVMDLSPIVHMDPIKFEDLTKESKSVLGTMELFDGFRFEFTKTLGETPLFGVSHAIAMGSTMEPPSYNFSSNLMAFETTMLIGRIDTDGHLMARWHQQITKNFQMKFIGQAVPEPHQSAASIEADYKGRDWFGTFKWATQGIYGLSYSQLLTPRFSLGGETFYHHKQGISVYSLGGRYETPEYVATGMLSAAHVSASYTHKVTPRISLSTEITAGWGSGQIDSVAIGGFEYSLRTSHLKCHMDSNGKVTAFIEEMMNQFTNISLCAELDHSKKQYHFGFGVTMNVAAA